MPPAELRGDEPLEQQGDVQDAGEGRVRGGKDDNPVVARRRRELPVGSHPLLTKPVPAVRNVLDVRAPRRRQSLERSDANSLQIGA